MQRQLRTTVFWLHLSSGVIAGLIVLVMAATGTVLAFQSQLMDWAESGSRRVTPRGQTTLTTEAILARAREARPKDTATALTIYADHESAVRVATGRDSGVHVDPYTGDVRELAGGRWRQFFALMIEWHRYLGMDGDRRAIGKGITGACNAAFLLLALSGLYLWWPRKWNLRAMRLSLWFRRGLASRVRDWNWHNVIGFWSLPVLILLTSSGAMISYRWVSSLVYRAAGESPPTAGAGPAAAPLVRAPSPKPGAKRLDVDGLRVAVNAAVPGWSSATFRMGRGGAQTLALSVKSLAGPPFTAVQLTLDPVTGDLLQREGYGDYTRGRKLRTWLRFLHTGEALGWAGQFVAGLASLGATLLVWTGLSLAIRRLLRWRPGRSSPSPE
jgi:uncharacterized iron-regulated membrane protein